MVNHSHGSNIIQTNFYILVDVKVGKQLWLLKLIRKTSPTVVMVEI